MGIILLTILILTQRFNFAIKIILKTEGAEHSRQAENMGGWYMRFGY
jgi:hypothetical protein